MNEYIKNLINLGFNESEAKVYFNLLKKNNFSAAEFGGYLKPENYLRK